MDDDIENSIIPTFPPDHPRGLFSKLGESQLERIGIPISDQSLNRNFQESNKMEPICYGGVKVEGQEAEALLLHLKMRLLEQVEMEVEKCYSTVRWNQMRKGTSRSL